MIHVNVMIINLNVFFFTYINVKNFVTYTDIE